MGQMQRIVWVKNVVVLAMLAGVLASLPLWLTFRSYPLIPAISGLPSLVPPWDVLVLTLLLLSLALALIARRPRKWIVSSIVLAAGLAFFDQSRWQPWVYQYLLMLGILGSVPWQARDGRGTSAALRTIQFTMVSIYIWSGIQKFNPGFAVELVPRFIQPFRFLIPASLIYVWGFAVPLVEIGIGVALLVSRARRWGVAGAIAMHVLILMVLGPFGSNSNGVVWPWNIAMIALVALLFGGWPGESWRKFLRMQSSWLQRVVLVLVMIMPIFSLIGLWPSYLSWSLYSGNIHTAQIVMSQEVVQRLPPSLQQYVEPQGDGGFVIDPNRWSYGELFVPQYPEKRVYQALAKDICRQDRDSPDIVLMIQERWSLQNPGYNRVQRFGCGELK